MPPLRYPTLPVTLRQLQYVCAVADELSFRRAAERCAVSQPALSNQIAEVERALGLRLFDRDRRGVLITPGGEAVIARARRLLADTDELIAAARDARDPLRGRLTIGVIPTIAPYVLPDLDPAWRAAFDGLRIEWTEAKTAQLVAALEAGELDAAVVALVPELESLEHALIGVEPFVLAAAPGHHLATGRAPVPESVLGGEDVWLLDEGHCFGDQARDLCSAVGARHDGFAATSLTTMVQMAAGSGGLTVLPLSAVPVENRNDTLVVRPFTAPAPTRTLVLAWRRGSARSEAFAALAEAASAAFEVLLAGDS